MWILMIILALLNLIFVCNRKTQLSKITISITMIVYLVLSWHDMLNIVIAIKSGVIGVQIIWWYVVNMVLLLSLIITMFKELRKTSLWLSWILLILMVLGNWNTWLIPIFIRTFL